MTDISTATPADFLVCGACHRNFLLSSMQDFMQHKLFDCEGVSGKSIECKSCPRQFHTPWSLLQHAQKTHALKIFLEEGPYPSGIQSKEKKEATSKRDTISQTSVGTNTEESWPKYPLSKFVDPFTQTHIVKSPPNGHILDSTSAGLPAPINTHSVVTRSSNVATPSVPRTSLQTSTTSTTSASVSPTTSVAIVLPKLVQVSDKTQPLIPGSHAISVLQPIQLPQGTVLGAPIDSLLSKISLSPLPVVQPLVQAKLPVVQAKLPAVPVQRLRPATPMITLTTPQGRCQDPTPTVTLSAHATSNQSPPQMSSSMLESDATRQRSARVPDGSPESKPVEVPTQLSQIPDVSQGTNVGHVIHVGQVPNDSNDGQVPGVVQIPTASRVSDVGQVPIIDQGVDLGQKPIIREVPNVGPKPNDAPSNIDSEGAAPNVGQGPSSVTSSTDPSPQTTPTIVKNNLASLLACVCPCCKVGKCCIRGIQISAEPCCPSNPAVTETGLTKGGPIETNSSPTVASPPPVVRNDAAVQANNSKCCCKSDTRSLKRKRDAKTDENPQGELNGEEEVEEEVSEKGEEDTIQCCDNQDCGVTIMPGTHEGLKKCCNAVVPKKRKRHMETKHRIKKRAAAEASFPHPEENTIYIDYFQPISSAVRPHVSTSVAGVTLGSDSCRTITVNTSSSPGTQQVSSGGRDNPSSLTLSIPVSYTRKTSCSSGSCSQPSGEKQDCGCGCCPLMGYSNREKKLSKSGRRLSSGSTDSRRDVNSDSRASGQNNDLKVKMESSTAGESGGERGSAQDDRVGPRKTIRPGISSKKRRYPTSRPFKCDQCDNAFNQRIHLKKHQSKHTGIKPFKCEQCDYSTVERSHLKVHIRVHTGEKPFKCSHCEYATAQNSTLKIHLKRHHGQGGGEDESHAPFSCTVCDQEFDDEGPYLQHLQDNPSHAPGESHTSNSGTESSSTKGKSGVEKETAEQVQEEDGAAASKSS